MWLANENNTMLNARHFHKHALVDKHVLARTSMHIITKDPRRFAAFAVGFAGCIGSRGFAVASVDRLWVLHGRPSTFRGAENDGLSLSAMSPAPRPLLPAPPLPTINGRRPEIRFNAPTIPVACACWVPFGPSAS